MTTDPLSPRAALLGPILAVLAHLLALAAIASFTLRVGQAPVAQTRLYAAAVLLSAAAVAYAWRRASDGRFSNALWVASLAPLLAVFVLYASYGGPYAPYDPFDSDIVSAWCGTLSSLIAVAAVVAGSWRLLGLGLIAQGALYLVLLPASLWVAARHGVANLVDAQVLTPSMAAYVVGAAVLAARRSLHEPGAAALLGGMAVLATSASLLLGYTIAGLPPNGASLSHYESGWSVPIGAWDWLRQVAIVGSLVAALLVFGALCFQLGAGWSRRQTAWGFPIVADGSLDRGPHLEHARRGGQPSALYQRTLELRLGRR